MSGSLLQRVLEPTGWQLAMLAGAARCPSPAAPAGWRAPTRAELSNLDLDKVAADVVDRYRDEIYPAAVLGANHGSVAYLAALLGAAWLPSGFDLPSFAHDGSDARAVLHDTGTIGRRLRTLFPGAAVSQRFPAGRLRLTWGALPPAYRRFLSQRVRPGGLVLVVRDVVPALVLRDGLDGSVQLERDPLDGPAGNTEVWYSGTAPLARPGFAADALRFARQHRLAGVQLLFNDPDLLSQLVADATRRLLRDVAVADSWLVVQHGCRIDTRPLAAGAVPYWCADAGLGYATNVECWLAGSRPFRHIDLALEPCTDPRSPSMTGWMSACRFAAVSASVDLHEPTASSLPLPAEHSAGHPAGHPAGFDAMPYTTADEVLGQLALLANRSGLLLT
jgi:hypothetical protein